MIKIDIEEYTNVDILDSLIVFIEQIRPLTKRSNLYKILDSRVTFECRRNSEPHWRHLQNAHLFAI